MMEPLSHEQKARLSTLIETSAPTLTKKFIRQHYPIDQVEVILQETFLAACRDIETVLSHEDPETWLISVAMHRAQRLGRQLGKERKRHVDFPEEMISTHVFQEDTIDEILPKNTPPRDRKILKLYFEQRLTTDEIAQEVGVKPATARKQLTRARDRLKKILGTNFLIFLI